MMSKASVAATASQGSRTPQPSRVGKTRRTKKQEGLAHLPHSRLMTAVMEKLGEIKVRAEVTISEHGTHIIVFCKRASLLVKTGVTMMDEIIDFIIETVKSRQPKPVV